MTTLAERTRGTSWCRDGLRTRYRPKSSLGRGLIEAAPWITVLLLLGMFWMLESKVVLSPGTAVELPATSGLTGTSRGLTAVVLSHRQSGAEGERTEMIFFDDEPFAVDQPAQMRDLRGRLARIAAARPGQPLIVEADVRVRYGTIMELCNMAAMCGLKVVNLAGRPSEERPRE